ncbi:MAG: OmpA family protein [Clostridiaceae bacterium]|jgi:chemotaxis protein MotB|nr:OmpA family protein [Clostridiaceae bacterium]
MSKANRRSFSEDEVQEGAPEWMTTYSDLVTLLLTFFILLFSMASVDSQKFKEVAISLRSAFMNVSNGELYYFNEGKDIYSVLDETLPSDVGDENTNNDNKEGGNISATEGQDKEATIKQFKKQVEDLISDLELDEYVHVVDDKTSIILRIDSVILFDIGKADIKGSGKETIKKLAELMRRLDTNIVVQGHTDTLPINTSLFPTNWELSTKRATNVVIFLVDECSLDPTQLTATGNGEFRPIAPNDTEVNRQKNRRIDIVIDKE